MNPKILIKQDGGSELNIINNMSTERDQILNPLSYYFEGIRNLLLIIEIQKKIGENSSDKQLQQASDANVLISLAWETIKYVPPRSSSDYFYFLDSEPKSPLSLDSLKQIGREMCQDALNEIQAVDVSQHERIPVFYISGITLDRYTSRSLPKERDFNGLFPDEEGGFTARYKLAEMILKTALLLAGWRHLRADWNNTVMALPEETRKSAELFMQKLLFEICQCEIDIQDMLGNGNWNVLSVIEKVYRNEEITDDDLQSLIGGYQISDRQIPSNEDLRAIEPDIREEFLFDLYIVNLLDRILRDEINFPQDAASLKVVLENQLNRFPELREKAEKYLSRGRLEREERERQIKTNIIKKIIELLLRRLRTQEFKRSLEEALNHRREIISQYQDGVFSAERLGRDFGHAYGLLLLKNGEELLVREKMWWEKLGQLLAEIKKGKWPKDLFLAVLRQRWPETYSGEPVDLLGYESEDPNGTGWRE